jgi:hypothetical protein
MTFDRDNDLDGDNGSPSNNSNFIVKYADRKKLFAGFLEII